jgi:hypothetical protein
MRINTLVFPFMPTFIPKHYHSKALTLVEMSMVIGLILSLISLLFYGVANFRAQADKSRCVIKQSQLQKNLRTYCAFNNLEPGTAWPTTGGANRASQANFEGGLTDPTALIDPLNTAYDATGVIKGNPALGSLGYQCPITARPSHKLIDQGQENRAW